jgi:hypothetical protein
MRRLSWGRTVTISLALITTFCVVSASPTKLSLNWTDTHNENGFRVEHQLGSTEGA